MRVNFIHQTVLYYLACCWLTVRLW